MINKLLIQMAFCCFGPELKVPLLSNRYSNNPSRTTFSIVNATSPIFMSFGLSARTSL